MRILRVQFKNLNSLAGEWAIDFTVPAYANDGIFAITGPTGAGKSTILDAISLGLYGRTPRLDKISKGVNEIMSRRTGDCSAEVTFETQKGRFRCTWSQRRARKKADGELQQPSHEIADTDTGQILESKMKDVLARVEAVTGMTFSRFSQSMLLAQGGFAAFLEAQPKDRAPILEQITGTEIYSDISIAVHERNREEETKLRELQSALAGFVLLTAEEEETMRGQLAGLAEREKELGVSLQQKNTAIAWLEGMARLREELEEIAREETALRERDAAFAPERGRLALARQALDLAGEFSALEASRQELNREKERLGEQHDRLPLCTAAATQAAQMRTEAEEQLRLKREEQTAAQALFRSVRILDVKIQEKEKPLTRARDRAGSLAEELQRLLAKRDDDTALLRKRRQTLEITANRLRATAKDERLVQELAELRGSFENIQFLRGRRGQAEADCETARREAANAEAEHRKQTADAENRRRERDARQEALRILSEQRQALLGPEDEAQWRTRSLDLRSRHEAVEKARAAQAAVTQLRRKIADRKNGVNSFDAALGALWLEINALAEHRATQQKAVILMEENSRLLARIKSYEEERAGLRDGEPCPLCGAADHPYAGGHAPALDSEQARLAAARTELEHMTTHLHQLEVERKGMEKDREAAMAEAQELEKALAETRIVLRNLCVELGLNSSPLNLEPRLASLQVENDATAKKVSDTLDKADAFRREIETLRSLVEQAGTAVSQSEQDALKAAHAAASAGQAVARLEKEREGIVSHFDAGLVFLQHAVGEYGIDSLTPDTLEKTYEILLQRREAWQANERKKLHLEQEIRTSDAVLQTLTKRIAESEENLAGQHTAVMELEREFDLAVAERKTLFADRDADTEEQALVEAAAVLAAGAENARKQHDAAVGELSGLQAAIADLEQTIANRNAGLDTAGTAFAMRLTAKGFSDEATYKAACLSEEERGRLEAENRRLEAEATRLAVIRQEKSNLLLAEEEKKLTPEGLDVLAATRTDLSLALRQAQQETGAISRSLDDNDEARRRHSDRVREAEAQKRECTRWQAIDKLIGSHDGGKYRTFAQGLTFDLMIRHANRQLQSMSDRYLLVRDPAEPLELQVIDGYQDDLPRSTRNLSGGESFLVSLALALGLSGMASRNVRVNSLFLDEGFGSLDEDALDTALDTLSSLKREGRLIGAISHVPAVKERIGVQITVTPLPGGVSRIDGPGCRKVE